LDILPPCIYYELFVIVDGKKECKYVSVLAKGVTKRWLCPRVEDERRSGPPPTHAEFCKTIQSQSYRSGQSGKCLTTFQASR